MTEPITIDFETAGIVGNPTIRPPKPVGVATKRPGYKSRYLSWGHPAGNTHSYDEAKAHLLKLVDSGAPLLFHNAKFDLSVMREWFGITVHPDRVHDTMFMIALHDPYADTFSLKPSAERILDWPPDEQDALRDWILAHVPEATLKEWGAHIDKSPADICAPYARGDVDRTFALWKHLHDKIPLGAYDRERALLPIIMESELRGVKVDVEKLHVDMTLYEASLLECDKKIYKLLGTEVDLGKPEQLADALESAGMIGEWVKTPTGKRSTSRENLQRAIANPDMLGLLCYRGALSHCLSSFGRPWIELSSSYNGRMHPDWNQVRQARGNDVKGTRTGRLSCGKPNFQNMPNEYDLVIPRGLPELPIMRQYLIPDDGYVWLKRDYSQQELRILAHYSDGRLLQRYQADPTIDAHDETKSLIHEYTGLELPRKHVKIVGFSIIYGSGTYALSLDLGVPPPEGKAIKEAYFTALPEVPELMKTCMKVGRSGGHITTWGGREYVVEPPRVVKGRTMSFEYKLLNYLIQGSAGDCTKESLIRWNADKGNGQFLATVHDENDIQAPKESWKQDMKKMKKAMEGIEFDVKMLSDGFVGPSWFKLEKCA